MCKEILVPHKLLRSVSVHVAGVCLISWEWSLSRGHSRSGGLVGTPAVATSWAYPQRVLLGLVLLLLRLLGLHLPVAGPKHGAVLVLVVISPVAGLVHLLPRGQGKTKKVAPYLAEQ